MKNIPGLLLVITGLLAGCATTANYEKTLNSWVGHSESALISSWGPPSNSYTSGDTTSLSFGGTRGFVFMSGMAIPVSCVTTFTLKNKVVTNWTWSGNGCKQ